MSLCYIVGVYISLQLLIPGLNTKIPDLDGQGYTYDTQTQTLSRIVDNKLPKVLHFQVHNNDNGLDYMKLKRNDNIDINTPICYTELGDTVCHYGYDQNVAFYHSHDKSGAFSVMAEPKSNKFNVEGDLVLNKELYRLEPGGLLSNFFVNKTTHYIKKRSIYGTYGRYGYYTARRMVQLRRMSYGQYGRNDFMENDNIHGRKYTVELLILVDYSLYRKFYEKNHGNDEATMTKLKYYFAHIVNGMDLRYSSIDKKGFGLNVRLAGFYVAKNSSDLPFIITYRQGGDERSKVDGGTTLLDLTNFLRGKHAEALPHYDHAMLFTEYDATNGRGYILGTSYLSGICTPMSTSVIVDHGSYNSAGIAAHELGHNLGVVYHDGDQSPIARGCPKELNYIMAPSSAIINNQTKEFSFKFSDCSINQIEKQIKKLNNRKNCLAEDPGTSFATLIVKPYLAIPPGQMEDVHTQCRQIYGETSFMCPPKSPDEMCYKMYCYNPERRICITASEQRAALGSSCGDKKWCKLGRCVSDPKAPSVPDDCPFPDVPPPKALCAEEASPFRCESDPVFFRRCCKSCHKNFTEEDRCKDSNILINGLRCSQFMATYGSRACEYDQNVQNYCCKSCALAGSRNSIKSIPTTASSLPCKDNTYVRINGLDCQTFVLMKGKRVCKRPMVQKYCCFSCL